MYHVNAWSMPYTTAMAGAKLVLGGPHFDAPTLQALIVDEGVDMALAVPTVWLAMLQHLESLGNPPGGLGRLRRTGIGGSAVPRSMIEAFDRLHGVTVVQLWGMTETSPLGTMGMPTPEVAALPYDAAMDMRTKQGRGVFGVEMRIVADDGAALPHDGRTFGRLLVRGPWVVARYFGGEGGDVLDGDGWFDTGDVATIDVHGYMQITDRSKDVIKSGGEWISSIALENEAMGCVGVAQAAVIGVPHPRWDERPLLVIVRKPGSTVSAADVLAHLEGRIAKWWTPDAIEFVDALPLTATGKILKMALRVQFAGYRLG
jgi:acyl-CoA synthetase (AMP-forming)/AMP-acid ligase II